MTAKHGRELYTLIDNAKANKTDVTNSLGSKLNLSGGTMTGDINTNGNRVIVTRTATQNDDVVNKQTVDTGLATKKNTGTFDTKI
jgi:hypothetical protein